MSVPSPSPSLGSLQRAAGPREGKGLSQSPRSLRSQPGARPEALGLGCSGANKPLLLAPTRGGGRRGNFPEDLGSPLRKQEPPAPRAPCRCWERRAGEEGSRKEGIPPGPGLVGGGCQSSRRAGRLLWTAWLRSCATPAPRPIFRPQLLPLFNGSWFQKPLILEGQCLVLEGGQRGWRRVTSHGTSLCRP